MQAETDFAGSRYDYIVSVLQLRLAAGNLDREQLNEINAWLTLTEATSPAVQTPETLAPTVSPEHRWRTAAGCAAARATADPAATASPAAYRGLRPALLLQQRLDQRQQLAECAAVGFDRGAPMRTHARARLRGSASSALTRAASSSASWTTSAAPRAISRRAISSALRCRDR